jgi:hypothetical protein
MKNKTMVGVKARTYRIPVKLAAELWEFEEGSLVSRIMMDFQDWEEDRLSDKAFLFRMKEYMRLLEEFRGSILSEALARAIYDGHDGKDIEWTEPTEKAEELTF